MSWEWPMGPMTKHPEITVLGGPQQPKMAKENPFGPFMIHPGNPGRQIQNASKTFLDWIIWSRCWLTNTHGESWSSMVADSRLGGHTQHQVFTLHVVVDHTWRCLATSMARVWKVGTRDPEMWTCSDRTLHLLAKFKILNLHLQNHEMTRNESLNRKSF